MKSLPTWTKMVFTNSQLSCFEAPSNDTFNLIHRDPVLDNEAYKFKSELLKRGSLASRHSKTNPSCRSINENIMDMSVHDSVCESTTVSSKNDQGFYASISKNSNDLLTKMGSNVYAGKINEDDYILPTKTNFQYPSPIDADNTTPSIYSNCLNGAQHPVNDWSCEQVEQWLIVNDLSIYADKFIENLIDGEKLVDLDTAKLKVSPVYIHQKSTCKSNNNSC